MADQPDQDWWLRFLPHPWGDPGPEVYAALAALPPDKQTRMIQTINAARQEVEAARVKGYQSIGAALGAAGKS